MIASNTCHIKVNGLSFCRVCITSILTPAQIKEAVEKEHYMFCTHESLYSATKFADWLKEQGVQGVEIIPGDCDQRFDDPDPDAFDGLFDDENTIPADN